MRTRDIISLISKIRDSANRFITNEMEQWGVKGLATSHGDILFVLLKNERLTMKEIAEKIGRDKSTVTALVNKLVQMGYVKKSRDDEDGRTIFVSLTAEGRKLESMFNTISDDLFSTVYKGIPQNEREEIIKILEKIKDNF